MSELCYDTGQVNIGDLEPCPVRICIHTAKQIERLENVARNEPDSLPPIEVAILNGDRKFIVKRHSVCEVLRRTGIRKFKAKFHHVKNLTDVVVLHAQMSQSTPINPLGILSLRDFLVRNGMNISHISRMCHLDPSYEKLITCVISTDAQRKLSEVLDKLASKLTKVVVPSYLLEILSKKPQEIQSKIIDMIFGRLDSKDLVDRNFVFPNQAQIQLAADWYGKPEKSEMKIFSDETEIAPADNDCLKKHTLTAKHCPTKLTSVQKKEYSMILGNVPHMGILELNGAKYRVDWKNSTYSKVRSTEDGFILIKGSKPVEKIYALEPDHVGFLKLADGDEPHMKTIMRPAQLGNLLGRLRKDKELRIIVLSNKKL